MPAIFPPFWCHSPVHPSIAQHCAVQPRQVRLEPGPPKLHFWGAGTPLGEASPQPRAPHRVQQQPCSLPDTKWQPLPGFGAAPGQQSLGAAGRGREMQPAVGLQHGQGVQENPKMSGCRQRAGCYPLRHGHGAKLSPARVPPGAQRAAGSSWHQLLSSTPHVWG